MVLSVNNSLNNPYNRYQAKSKSEAVTLAQPVFSKSDCKKADKSCNGKFDFSQALKNFGKGLVSPITSMFSSTKNFLIGAGMIAASTALVVATGGAAAPILVAVGLGMGAVQAGQGVYKVATAKSGDDIEKAFYDFGGSTGAIGLSLVGAKASLKQAGVNADGMDTFSASAKCFKDAKSFIISGKESFQTGAYKTNLKSFIRPYLYKGYIRKLSKKLANDARTTFEQDFEEVKAMHPEEFRVDLKGRPKSESSTFDKLVERCTFNSKIKKAQKNTEWTPETKAQEIETLKAKKEKFKSNKEEYAKQAVDDNSAFRQVIKDPVTENIDKIVESWAEAIKNGAEIVELKNYHGVGNEKGLYFNEKHIAMLDEAARSKGIDIKALHKKQPKPSGYCAVQIKLKLKSGAFAEDQIRGIYVDEIANWEHIVYSLRQGKDLTRGNNELGKLFAPLKKIVNNLSEKQYKQHEKYISELYKHARDKEMSIHYDEPKLPDGLNPKLGAESLRSIFEISKKINVPDDKYFTMIPQLASSYSIIPDYKKSKKI